MSSPKVVRAAGRLAAVWRAYADAAVPPLTVRDVNAWRAGVATRARRDPDLRALATDLVLEHPDASPSTIAAAVRLAGDLGGIEGARTAVAAAIAAEHHAAATRAAQAAGTDRHAALLAEPPRWALGAAGIAAARQALEDAAP
jgi:hypothetical protein